MSGLLHPLRLAFLLPWLLLLVVLFLRQLRALSWIDAHVAPRFRHRLTRYPGRGPLGHFLRLFLIGGLLLFAAAGPYREAEAEGIVETRTLVIAVDASLSMAARDSGALDDDGAVISRFALAKRMAGELLEAMPEARFALLSFSGQAVLHSPPTRDLPALSTLIGTLSHHYYSESSGSRFSTALDPVVSLLIRQPGSYQVVLFSDGEMSAPDEYDEPLEILADHGVPVHTVGLGGRQPVNMVIYDLEDLLARVEKPRRAGTYETQRQSEHLQALSGNTGGAALVAEWGQDIDDLVPHLLAAQPEPVGVGGRAKQDLSFWPLLAAAVLVAWELAFFLGWRRREPRSAPSPWSRLARRPAGGQPTTATALLLVPLAFAAMPTGCAPKAFKAHFFNERGLASYETGHYGAAISHFERSATYGVRPHVPTFNLANALLESGEPARAHEIFTEALKEEPRFAEALHNDGFALYRWGQDEIDLEQCLFERARTLWQQARRRFETVVDQVGESSGLGSSALEAALFLEEHLGRLDEAEESCEPPPSPNPPPPPDEQNDGEPPPSSQDPPGEGDPPEPPPGESPPESDPSEGMPPPLSPEEHAQIAQELERIRSQAAGARGYRHSGLAQLTPEGAAKSKGGKKPIWW